jgi:tetratricopeptide (TPR) repeat protein
MPKTWRAAWLIWLCCVVFIQAANAAPKELSDQELSALAVQVDKADKLFKSGKFEEALVIYQEAYNLTEEPTMLFSAAQCYRNLEKYEEATTNYRSFLAKAPEDNELRPLAQQLLAEVETKRSNGATDPKTAASKTKPKHSLYFFVAAGTAGAAGAGLGAAALLAAKGVAAEQSPEGDENTAADLTQKSKRRALASDLSFVAAVGLGLGGFVISKKEQEKTTLLIGPSQVAIAVEF